jgi:hypothetical protein
VEEGLPRQAVFAPDGSLLSVSSERQELLCSLIGLLIKASLVGVVAVSLVRLATAYQERMDRQGELSAVLELEAGKLAKARERFDQLFVVDGEQRLIREQNQWIAPVRKLGRPGLTPAHVDRCHRWFSCRVHRRHRADHWDHQWGGPQCGQSARGPRLERGHRQPRSGAGC